MTLEYIHEKFADGQLGIKCSNTDERIFVFKYGNEVLGLPKSGFADAAYDPNYPYVAFLFGHIVGWSGDWSGPAPDKITFHEFMCALNKQPEDNIIGLEGIL